MKEIRIYVEGGGDKDSKAAIRVAFSQFLNTYRLRARSRKLRWDVIACGSRESAYEKFIHAVDQHGDAFNVLLVDSEGPVQGTARQHLSRLGRWKLTAVTDDQVHLMVEVMESWFLTAPAKLAAYYGRNFSRGALPANPDVESIPKAAVLNGLDQATRGTTKGRYQKGSHAPDILKLLDPAEVRAPHCARLLEALDRRLSGP
ncbi:MAG TPA: DUF4276 family protein [Longimicrobium sp.]